MPAGGGETTTEETVLYQHRNIFTAYASAKQADMIAFGLASGLVRVMGGVVATQFVSPTGAVVAPPLPALPRYFEYMVKTAVLKLAFSPDGTSIAILYQSCLVVQSITNSNVKRVYYFGTEHTRAFMDMIHSDEAVYVRESSGRLCRFSLVDGSFGHEVPPVVFEDVGDLWTAVESTEAVIAYDRDLRRMKFWHYMSVPGVYTDFVLGEMLPPSAPEPDFFVASDEDNRFFWTAGPEGVSIFNAVSKEIIASYRLPLEDSAKFLVGYRCLYTAVQVDDVVKIRRISFDPDAQTIHVCEEREVPFGEDKVLMDLSRTVSLLTTRFQASRPLYILQPLRIQNIVLNAHLFPVEEEESEEDSDDEEADDEEADDEDDEEEESSTSSSPAAAAVLAASFQFPQPLHGLQRIIALTKDCVENADSYLGMDPWSPDEFKRIRAACHRPGALDEHYYPAKRLYARALMVIADVREVMHKMDVEVQKFVDFYGASATLGQFEFDDDDDPEGGGDDAYGFKRAFDSAGAGGFTPALDLDGILKDADIVRLKFTLNRVKLVEAIHDENLLPLDAVNTGVVSTLNCMKSQFKDVLSALLKYARGAKQLTADMRATRKRKAE